MSVLAEIAEARRPLPTPHVQSGPPGRVSHGASSVVRQVIHQSIFKATTRRSAVENMAPDAKDPGMTTPASGIAQGIPVGVSNRCADAWSSMLPVWAIGHYWGVFSWVQRLSVGIQGNAPSSLACTPP